jgi:toxin ParE1/3/4
VDKFQLTNRAVTDLSDIADFTIQTFGIEQARSYRNGLNHCFEILAENPQLGRNVAELAPNLKRFEYQSHIVFYIPKESHILIVRILHQRMEFKRHLPESLTK